MICGTHFNTQEGALEFLANNNWLEIGVSTWISPNGTHIASIRPVQAYALDLRQAPVVAVDVAFVEARQ